MIKAHALTSTSLGLGYQFFNATSSSHQGTSQTTTSGLEHADTGCGDVWSSFNPNTLTGDVSALSYYEVTFVNRSVNQWITEWIGAFSGQGAERALANLSRDYRTCKQFGVKNPDGSVTDVAAHPLVPEVMLGIGTSGYLMTLATKHLTFASSVGRFGNNLVGISVTDPIIPSAIGGTFTPYKATLTFADVHAVTRLIRP